VTKYLKTEYPASCPDCGLGVSIGEVIPLSETEAALKCPACDCQGPSVKREGPWFGEVVLLACAAWNLLPRPMRKPSEWKRQRKLR